MDVAKSTKVFIFDRKELFLLFFFFTVMAVTSFILGMRLGKKQSDFFLGEGAHVHAEKSLDLKSHKEEELNVSSGESGAHHGAAQEEGNLSPEEAFKDQSADSADASHNNQHVDGAHKDIDEETFKKLQDEFSKINSNEISSPANDTKSASSEVAGSQEATETPDVANAKLPDAASNASEKINAEVSNADSSNKQESNFPNNATDEKFFLKPDPSFIGKFTIQLGAYRTLAEAQDYAQGFLTKGYKPLIKEAELPGSGTWYRVSLGVFESISAAKQYIQNEKTLFSAQNDYLINEIK